MNILHCRNCQFFIDRRADSVLCQFELQIHSRPVNQNQVISCPRQDK